MILAPCPVLRRLYALGSVPVRVLAALELGSRLASDAPGASQTFRAPADAARYLLPRYAARPVETFGLLALDVRHRLKREAVISVGCLTSSLVHPREVFQEAVVARAAALVRHRVGVADAERERRVVVEEERGDVIVVDEDERVRPLLGEPLPDRHVGREDRPPDGVVGGLPVVGEADGRGVRGRDRTDDSGHLVISSVRFPRRARASRATAVRRCE